MKKLQSQDKIKNIFLLPAVISLLFIGVLPFLASIFMSFRYINLINPVNYMKFVGLENFISVIMDKRALHSLLITVYYYAACIILETVLALAVSFFLNRQFKGKNLVRGLIIIPMFITPIVVGLVWRMLYDPTSGLINYFLSMAGIGRVDWLGNRHLSLLSIVLVDAWEWTPYLIIIFLAGLDSIPEELMEAALVDGAGRLKAIYYIILPLMRPTIVIGVMLRSLDIIKTFDIIYAMTKGGPGLATETANMYAYILGFNFFDVSKSIAFILILTILITVIFSKAYNNSRLGGAEIDE